MQYGRVGPYLVIFDDDQYVHKIYRATEEDVEHFVPIKTMSINNFRAKVTRKQNLHLQKVEK